MTIEKLAQDQFGIQYAGWVQYLEHNYKEPFDQIENRLRNDKDFYWQFLGKLCTYCTDIKTRELKEIVDFLLSF